MKRTLLELRRARGYTQAQIAKRLGISIRTLRRWESNINSPSDWQLIKLSKIYRVVPNNIICKRRYNCYAWMLFCINDTEHKKRLYHRK